MNNKQIGIIIPLRARANSKDWNATCAALFKTLLSLTHQSCYEFHCVVVSHDHLHLELPSFCTKKIDFDVITDEKPTCYTNYKSKAQRQKAIDSDKNQKILRGLKYLRALARNFSHWFTLDADDLVSIEFVKTILRINPKHGLILRNGYEWETRTDRIRLRKDLHKICGSTSILSDSCIPSKEGDLCQTPWFRYSHMNIIDYFYHEKKVTCDHYPNSIVCYVHHHDNSNYHHAKNPRAPFSENLYWRVKQQFFWSKRTPEFNRLFPSACTNTV